MLRGLWKLTWLEIKIFLREPLGAFGSILFPVLVFVVVSRFAGGRRTSGSLPTAGFLRVGLPVFVSVLIALSGVLSLVTIISIYREGGILNRLRSGASMATMAAPAAEPAPLSFQERRGACKKSVEFVVP